MDIAVCDTGESLGQICGWIEQYCALYGIDANIICFSAPNEFTVYKMPLNAAFIAYGGSVGFLAARALRDRDRECKIVLIDDTREYAVGSVRLRCTDFVLRPLCFKLLVRCMQLITGRRPL